MTGQQTGHRLAGLAGAIMVAGCLAGCDRPALATNAAAKQERPSTASPGRVEKVVDGDTIDVRQGAKLTRVRVLGINAPEVPHPGKPGQCGGEAATAAMRAIAGGRAVRLVGDPTQVEQDRFGRRLAYVEVAGADVGRRLIEEGMAIAWWPPSAKAPQRGAAYTAVMTSAKRAGKGLWSTCGGIGKR